MPEQRPVCDAVVVKQPSTSGVAIAGLIFSILGWFTCGLLCIPGALLSFLGLFSRGPKGAAVAGLIVGFPGTIFFFVVGLGMLMGALGVGASATHAIATADKELRDTAVEINDIDSGSQDAGRVAPEIDHSPIRDTAEPVVEHTDVDSQDEPASSSEDSPSDNQRPNPEAPQTDLIIEDWRLTTEYGFVKAAGRVTNSTSAPLEHVTAVVTFLTADGSFVKTSESIISYDPLLPGQTSPFEVIETDNPAIARASLGFKKLLGGSLSATTREKINAAHAQNEVEQEESKRQGEIKKRAERHKRIEEYRTWTDATGQFSVKAMFMGYAAGQVTLRKEDGSDITVPIEKLSEDDRSYLREKFRDKGMTPPF